MELKSPRKQDSKSILTTNECDASLKYKEAYVNAVALDAELIIVASCSSEMALTCVACQVPKTIMELLEKESLKPDDIDFY